MIVREFGKADNDTIILLHGGGLSWWNYGETAELLKDRFHVVLPVLDGHAGSDHDFTSIADNAAEIIDYIDAHYDGKVKLMGGLSLGAQILLEILALRNDICEYAVIESALVFPSKAVSSMIAPSVRMSYGLVSKPWFAKLQFKSLKIKDSLYEDYFRDSSAITEENMVRFMEANSEYELKGLGSCRTRCLVIAGSKERSVMIRSAEKIHRALENSTLEIIEGYYHGDLSINHPEQYADRIKRLIK